MSCLGASDGQINVTANGGVPTYNYIWSFQGDIVNEWEGSTEQINLLPGEYTIAVSYTHLTLPTNREV